MFAESTLVPIPGGESKKYKVHNYIASKLGLMVYNRSLSSCVQFLLC